MIDRLPSESSDSEGSKLSTSTSATSHEPGVTHYNDWPNSQGFDTHYEEHSPIDLKVHGSIPDYAAGVLFRTGLGPRAVDDNGKIITKVNHWFDNFSQVHRFQIHSPESGSKSCRVTYNSRLTSDALIERVRKTGRLDAFTFGAKYDPCKSFFSKVQAMFTPEPKYAPNEVNNAVTMSINFPGISSDGKANLSGYDNTQIVTLCNKTDTSRLQMLDPETLEPIGLADQRVLHPSLTGPLSAAHAKSDPVTGDVYNYNLSVGGPSSTYRLFRASASTGKTTILATFKAAPAYIHSLFITEHYIILCVFNAHYKAGGVSILWNQNILDAMYHNDKAPATWYVVDKRCPETESGRGLVAIYESDPMFSFHTINAYEESNSDGGIDIIADLSAYRSMEVIKLFYIDNLISDAPNAKDQVRTLGDLKPTINRYRLCNVPPISGTSSSNSTKPRSRSSSSASTKQSLPKSKPVPQSSLSRTRAKLEFQISASESIELPTLNFNYACKPYRYTYGAAIGNGEKSSFVDGLIKYDLLTHQTTRWEVTGHTPGEAIFVPKPNASAEDDGVLLTVVLDGYKGTSYLLVLHARDMTEVGRAEVPGVVGFGFHGVHTTKTGSGNVDGLVGGDLHY